MGSTSRHGWGVSQHFRARRLSAKAHRKSASTQGGGGTLFHRGRGLPQRQRGTQSRGHFKVVVIRSMYPNRNSWGRFISYSPRNMGQWCKTALVGTHRCGTRGSSIIPVYWPRVLRKEILRGTHIYTIFNFGFPWFETRLPNSC